MNSTIEKGPDGRTIVTTGELVTVFRDSENVTYLIAHWQEAFLRLRAEGERLTIIVQAAWEVRREEKDHNPCPDLALRANARQRLHKLLDTWKAAEAAVASETEGRGD